MGTVGIREQFRLGDICLKIGSGATPRGGKDVYLNSGPFSFIRSQNVHNDGFRREGLAFLSTIHAQRLDNVEVLQDDVLLNITGDSVARSCQVVDEVLPARVNQHVAIIRPDQEILDAKYLRYWLVAPNRQATLLAWAGGGGTRNALTKKMIEALEIDLPSLSEQRSIAHTLGTLDSKIELNRQTNETLEEMARALFKSWFVDFDPVRAKVEGRWKRGESRHGLPAELYDLFPDRLIGSKLGPIPEGWKASVLGEVVEHRRRSVGPDHLDPETPLLSLQHMPKKSIALTDWSTASRVGSTKMTFRQGEILFGKLRPYFHKVGVAPVDGVCSTDIVVLAPKGRMWFGFVLGHVSSAAFVDYADRTSTGTRMPRANWKDMSRYDVVLPSESGAKAFTALVAPLIERIKVSIHESRKLAGVRDTLLPQLVNGGLRTKPKAWERKS